MQVINSFINRESVVFFIGLACVAFFSTYQLFASPETWMDEGLIIQSAQGLLETGKVALPVAPGVYEPAWYITTGFPLTLPLAGAFAVFGVSLEVARLVMLMFLLAFYTLLWFFARRAIGGTAGILGFFLLVFFGPLYGNGRNALGEIPGLLMVLIALWPLISGGTLTRGRALWAGIGAGLAVAAKPIFSLFLPALLLALLLRHQELKLKKTFVLGTLGTLAPIVAWVFLQFDVVSLSRVLSVYANPHDLDIASVIIANSKRLFTETQPLYFFTALLMWGASYVIRRFRREPVMLAEEALLFFSILVFLAYLRTAGYYRYFFPAQIFTLLYLPHSLWYLVGRRSQLFSRAVIVGVCGLILFQAYETAFRSWTATHYSSTRTEVLERYIETLPADEEIFVYQAPEIVPFLSRHPVYQYVEITPSIRAGEQYIPLVASGMIKRVITPSDFFTAHSATLFMHYEITYIIDSYTVAISRAR